MALVQIQRQAIIEANDDYKVKANIEYQLRNMKGGPFLIMLNSIFQGEAGSPLGRLAGALVSLETFFFWSGQRGTS